MAWAQAAKAVKLREGISQVDRSSPLVRLVVGGVVLMTLLPVGRIRHPLPNLESAALGTFVENGSVPGGESSPEGRRYWSSWAGSDDNRGTLVLGPFPAPARVGFLVRGYPRIGGNRLYLENAVSGEVLDPRFENFGEGWAPATVAVPASWIGEPIIIRAIDDAAEWGGWLALSEPFRVSWLAAWWNGTPVRLCVFLLVGTHLGILLLGASVLVRRFAGPRGSMEVPAAVAALAGAGYLLFWATLADHRLGSVAAWCLLAGTIAFSGRLRRGLSAKGFALPAGCDWAMPLGLTVGIGVFYFATSTEFSVESPMSYIAQHRYSPGMPADNVIPQMFAGRLADGQSPRRLMGDWLSSDRPPLQSGWVLMLLPLTRLAGVDFDTAAQCAGIWFQLIWVPLLWLFLRALGVRAAVVALIIAGLVPSGFFFFNSVYVWPKLGGAAFMLGAYSCWFVVPDDQRPTPIRFGLGGAFAALAWLSHGGVAFSFLALIPVALLRWREAGWRAWCWAGAAFLVGVVPWVAYQMFYEPPGNRLVKWHLAGVVRIDDRSFGSALADSYRELTWDEWMRGRRANIRTIFSGRWSELASFASRSPQAYPNAHGQTFFSLGWWNLGFLALPLVPWLPAGRWGAARIAPTVVVTAVVWALLTLAVWSTLMLTGGSTLVHQGSYAPLLVLFAVFALALWQVHPLVFLVVVILQAIVFVQVWTSKPARWPQADWKVDAAFLMLLSFGFLTAIAIHAYRRDGARR